MISRITCTRSIVGAVKTLAPGMHSKNRQGGLCAGSKLARSRHRARTSSTSSVLPRAPGGGRSYWCALTCKPPRTAAQTPPRCLPTTEWVRGRGAHAKGGAILNPKPVY